MINSKNTTCRISTVVIYKESEVMGHAKTLTRSKMGKTTAFRKEMNQSLQRYEKSIFLGIEKEAFFKDASNLAQCLVGASKG